MVDIDDDIDLGSDADVDVRLGYDPGDNFGPCVKLREDYVSSEEDSDEGFDDEDEEFVPPPESEHESKNDSHFSSDKEDGDPDVVHEKDVMEEETDE
ncbi:hypothetical protein FRX31_018305, partial [Thalictrum thalictroides]